MNDEIWQVFIGGLAGIQGKVEGRERVFDSKTNHQLTPSYQKLRNHLCNIKLSSH